jgi:predicted RNA binding protein YcfA (HicA-like mRNA interferase family)
MVYMKAKELLRILRKKGCIEARQESSHIIVRCGACQTTVAVHAGKDIPKGTLRAIERNLEPCLGKGWLK